MYKHYLFDLDGTLLNTLGDICGAVNYALKKNGFPTVTLDKCRRSVGDGFKELIKRTIPENAELSSEKIDEILKDFTSYYGEHICDLTKPYDGILELLKELKQKGKTVSIVSNKRDGAVKELAEIYFKGLIDYAVGENEIIGIKKKPNPDMVNSVLEKLNAKKEDCLYIGDSQVDLQTAKNSNLKCVAVSWGFRTKNDLTLAGATDIIDFPNEILKY